MTDLKKCGQKMTWQTGLRQGLVMSKQIRYSSFRIHSILEERMRQTQEERALQRGVRVAALWKKLRTTILGLDRWCVVWAQRHNLPAWSGHIPIIGLVTASVITCVIGGFFLISAILIFGATALVFGFLRTPVQNEVEITNWTDRSCSYKSPTGYDSKGDLGPGQYADNYKTSDDY